MSYHRSFDVFFYLRPNKRLDKQSWGWWFETPSRSLWCHYNVRLKIWWSTKYTVWRTGQFSIGSQLEYATELRKLKSHSTHTIWFSLDKIDKAHVHGESNTMKYCGMQSGNVAWGRPPTIRIQRRIENLAESTHLGSLIEFDMVEPVITKYEWVYDLLWSVEWLLLRVDQWTGRRTDGRSPKALITTVPTKLRWLIVLRWQGVIYCTVVCTVTHCRLVVPYGDIHLAKHWSR